MRAEPSVLFCSSAAVPPAEWIFPVLSLDYLARIRDNDSRVLLAESFEQEPPAAVSSRPVCNQLKEKTPEGAGGEMKPEQILQQFLPEGQTYTYRPFGNGHINDTFLVTTPERKLILQRINREVFKKPEEVMENFVLVTDFIRRKVRLKGGDADREVLSLLPTLSGKPYFVDPEGECWRITLFIDGAASYDQVKNERDFYESGYAFGHFQHLLEDFPAARLHETIPRFHDTPNRLVNFRRSVSADASGRRKMAEDMIAKAEEYAYLAPVFMDALKEGRIPLRVTHNDTKFNNIMIDDATGRGICVLDLDTVMPGLAMNDFGDSIRFGANTAVEDEQDTGKVSLNLPLYEVYTEGFVKGSEGSLTEQELRWLPMGAMMMTYENAIRFLADFLDGDTYYKTDYPEHNLVRTRVQFALLDDMKKKKDEMNRITERYI